VTTGIDVFVAELASTGAHLRSLRLGGAGGQFPGGVAARADGTLTATGYYQYAIDLPDASRPSIGSFDVFLAGLGR
jgi:hypothetical protein